MFGAESLIRKQMCDRIWGKPMIYCVVGLEIWKLKRRTERRRRRKRMMIMMMRKLGGSSAR